MTEILSHYQQLSYRELQTQYDYLSEEIQFLRKSLRMEDLSPRERFRLQKQIEDAQRERESIERQLEEKKNALTVGGEHLYPILMHLGYRQQSRIFRRLIEAESVAAFLIHGFPEYGQRWLLNRLVEQFVAACLTGKVVIIDASRRVRKNDVSALWRELAGRVGLKGTRSTPLEIAQKVSQWWQTQNVLIVLHDVHHMPETGLGELIQDFWGALVSIVHAAPSKKSEFKLLMFLIDYEGCVGQWEIPFAERLDANWKPQNPMKLPVISKFTDEDLNDWIDLEYSNLPSVLTGKADRVVQSILDNSEDGVPELALGDICDRCNCNWFEEAEKWMKL